CWLMNNGTSKATVIPELSNGEKCPSLHSALTSPVILFRLLSRPRVDTRAVCVTFASEPQAWINSTPMFELNSISVMCASESCVCSVVVEVGVFEHGLCAYFPCECEDCLCGVVVCCRDACVGVAWELSAFGWFVHSCSPSSVQLRAGVQCC